MTVDTSLLDHPIISERYFFPRREPLDDPFVVERDGALLHCHLHRVPDAPLLVHFHGNGEVVADWAEELSTRFASLGIGTLLAEYRGYGGSTGEPRMGAMLEDAVAMVQAARVPPHRIVAYGRSVGSIYALHAAATLGLAGLVIESGIADVRERLLLRMRPGELGATPAALDEVIESALDHRAKIGGFAGEVLVFHAAGDDLVPPDHGERLAEWAGERATFRLFENGDHNTIWAYNGEALVNETASFVHRMTSSA